MWGLQRYYLSPHTPRDVAVGFTKVLPLPTHPKGCWCGVYKGTTSPHTPHTPSFISENLDTGQRMQAFQPISFVPALLLCTIDLYRSLSLSVPFTLDENRKMRATPVSFICSCASQLTREAKVQIKQHLSQKRTLWQGVPQRGVLSPTLFLIFIRDILHRMPKDVRGAIYADDLALWCNEKYFTTANYRQQQALQVIESWAQSWLVKVNEKKTTFTIFSLSNQKHDVHLKLNGQTLHQEDAPTYLGDTLDQRLTWKKTSSRRTRLERRSG